MQMAPLLKAVSHQPTKANEHVNGESHGAHDIAINAEKALSETHEEMVEAQLEYPGQEAATDIPAHSSTSGGKSHPHKSTEDPSDDTTIQTLFDTAYLINATAIKNLAAENNELISLQNKLMDNLTLEARSVERMKKDAAEYWKRTSLLFGLLA